jgi:diguanylate cyclase (GGDEF)-like protein
MAVLSEAVEAGTQACAQPLASALPPALPPEVAGPPSSDNRQPQHPKLEDGRQLTIRLASSFGLLIGIMLGLGWWASYRSISADRQLKGALSKQTAKLRLTHEALLLSSANNRIVMQLLAGKSSTPELLADRSRNSQLVSAIIFELEEQCDSDKEKQLVLAVKQKRLPYLNSYQRALKVLLDDKDESKARVIMFEQAIPALFAYRAVWSELASFELQSVAALAEQRTQYDRATRRIGMTLQALAALLAAMIATFTTKAMARDLKLRVRMHRKLTTLNDKLEQSVARRTEELGRVGRQLRESLAQTQEYAAEIEAVNELAKLLQSCLTLNEAHQQASHVLEKFFPAGAVLLLNASRNLLEVVLSWGAACSLQGPFPPESCWGLRKGQAHLTGPHCRNPVCSHLDETAVGCHLCVPMVAQGTALGVLTIDDASFCDGHPESYRCERKLKLAHTLTEQISLAFANLKLRETLKYQSVRDPLTGLFNRRHMEEMLDLELCRAARTRTPVALLMIDIDHFKRFNDTFSHEAGDLVLREFGQLLRLQIRGGDVACRYGGEEFLLIMAETDVQSARQRAEALRERIAALQVRYRGESLRRITVSIGVAAFPAHGSSAGQMISVADGALYRAKREGRDRVVVAE